MKGHRETLVSPVELPDGCRKDAEAIASHILRLAARLSHMLAEFEIEDYVFEAGAYALEVKKTEQRRRTMAEKKKKWIAGAIKKPGSLRSTAKRMGLIKGDEKLSEADLSELIKRGSKKTQKRAHLARTLKKF